MKQATKIYIASPLGFSEVGRKFYYDVLVPLIADAGYEVLDPWVLTPQSSIDAVLAMPYGAQKRDAWRNLNLVIGENNRYAIDNAKGILAVLDGTDVDSGTASEVGYGYSRGCKIVGYRGDFRLSADNEGSIVNLQVEYFIKASGGTIVTSFAEIQPLLVKLLPLNQA